MKTIEITFNKFISIDGTYTILFLFLIYHQPNNDDFLPAQTTKSIDRILLKAI